MKPHVCFLLAFTLGCAALVACSGQSASSGSAEGGAAEGGIAEDGSSVADGSVSPGSDAGGADGGAVVPVNGCTAFVDETGAAAARKIVWDFTVATAPDRCMTVKVGQTVAFEGNFVTHPLGASGTAPSPFSSVPASGKITFSSRGTYGFVCGNHPSMTGAIRVQ